MSHSLQPLGSKLQDGAQSRSMVSRVECLVRTGNLAFGSATGVLSVAMSAMATHEGPSRSSSTLAMTRSVLCGSIQHERDIGTRTIRL